MDQPPVTRPSIWRFSLRELFLLVLAAAGFMGWAAVLYRSGRLKPTEFYTSSESWESEVTAVLQEIGEPLFQGSAGTMMHTAGPTSVQRTMVFRIPLPENKQRAFLNGLRARIQNKLKVAGCKLAGGASGSGANDVTVIAYTRDPVSGTVQLCVGDLGNDRASIVVTMQEQRGVQWFGVINAGQ